MLHTDNLLSLFQHMCNCGGAKCSLPVAADPPDGPLGQAGLRSHPAQAPHHEEASVPARQTDVSSLFI
jgi:hypothetical protein